MGSVEAELISILEPVGNCFLWAIDAHWKTIYFVYLDSKGEGFP